jgi:hypothetical protein
VGPADGAARHGTDAGAEPAEHSALGAGSERELVSSALTSFSFWCSSV